MADYLDREHREAFCGRMANCLFDPTLQYAVTPDCKLLIFINPDPITPENDSPQLREFMSSIIKAWQHQLDTVELIEIKQDI